MSDYIGLAFTKVLTPQFGHGFFTKIILVRRYEICGLFIRVNDILPHSVWHLSLSCSVYIGIRVSFARFRDAESLLRQNTINPERLAMLMNAVATGFLSPRLHTTLGLSLRNRTTQMRTRMPWITPPPIQPALMSPSYPTHSRRDHSSGG